MTVKAIFYEQAQVLTLSRHRDWYIEAGSGFGFAAQANRVPLMTGEFSRSAGELPIVFLAHEGSIMPAALLGLRESPNLRLSPEGQWLGNYVPAFVRRYPFIFNTSDETRFTLCLDEAFGGFNQERRGEPLFNPDGKPSAYLQRVLNFMRGYERHHARTREFCLTIQSLELLEPMQANVKTTAGEVLSVSGFLTVSRERLSALEDAQIASLARSGQLAYIYSHLISLDNFQDLVSRWVATDRRTGT